VVGVTSRRKSDQCPLPGFAPCVSPRSSRRTRRAILAAHPAGAAARPPPTWPARPTTSPATHRARRLPRTNHGRAVRVARPALTVPRRRGPAARPSLSRPTAVPGHPRRRRRHAVPGRPRSTGALALVAAPITWFVIISRSDLVPPQQRSCTDGGRQDHPGLAHHNLSYSFLFARFRRISQHDVA
jgi:hypothetical protein